MKERDSNGIWVGMWNSITYNQLVVVRIRHDIQILGMVMNPWPGIYRYSIHDDWSTHWYEDGSVPDQRYQRNWTAMNPSGSGAHWAWNPHETGVQQGISLNNALSQLPAWCVFLFFCGRKRSRKLDQIFRLGRKLNGHQFSCPFLQRCFFHILTAPVSLVDNKSQPGRNGENFPFFFSSIRDVDKQIHGKSLSCSQTTIWFQVNPDGYVNSHFKRFSLLTKTEFQLCSFHVPQHIRLKLVKSLFLSSFPVICVFSPPFSINLHQFVIWFPLPSLFF